MLQVYKLLHANEKDLKKNLRCAHIFSFFFLKTESEIMIISKRKIVHLHRLQ